MKAKLALLEANPSTSQTPKTFQPKNKGLVAETFDWDEEEVSDDEEVTQIKVLITSSLLERIMLYGENGPIDINLGERNQLKEAEKVNEKWLIAQKGLDAVYGLDGTERGYRRLSSPPAPQNPKAFQPKNKGLVAETFDWDEEEVSDDEEVTQVKVLMALVDDELIVGKNHAHNGEWIDITMRKRHIREPIWYLDSGCSRSMTVRIRQKSRENSQIRTNTDTGNERAQKKP
ncbi:hypothetical protein Tco_0805656 [Tanacetum coccineum]